MANTRYMVVCDENNVLRPDDEMLFIDISAVQKKWKSALNAMPKRKGNNFFMPMEKVVIANDGIYIEGLGLLLLDFYAYGVNSRRIKGVLFKRIEGMWSMLLILDSNPYATYKQYISGSIKRVVQMDCSETEKSDELLPTLTFPLHGTQKGWIKALKSVGERIEPFTYFVSMEKVAFSYDRMIIDGLPHFPVTAELLHPVKKESLLGITFQRINKDWYMILQVGSDNIDDTMKLLQECCEKYPNVAKNNPNLIIEPFNK
jgi:hypothetical protein